MFNKKYYFLFIHTYKFIRLYVLYQYNKISPLTDLEETLIIYCIKILRLEITEVRKERIQNF